MSDEQDVVPYHACEFLSADPIRDVETDELRVGFTVTDDETTINLCISQDDALLLLRQVAEVLYVLAGNEERDDG